MCITPTDQFSAAPRRYMDGASGSSGVSRFEKFDPDTDPRLAPVTRTIARETHCVLFEEGDPATTLYRIVQGAVMTDGIISKAGLHFVHLRKPGALAEMANGANCPA